MTAGIAQKLTYGSSCKRCIELHGCRVAGSSHNYGCVGHSAMVFECFYNIGNSRSLLANSHINTKYRIAFVEKFFLVDNGINSNSRFTSLAVADDKFTLSAPDRDHSVNCFNTGL